MNNAIATITRRLTAFVSPIEIFRAIANTITTAKPKAANGVSIGFIFKMEGNNKPRAPAISTTPIKWINPPETCLAHSIFLCASIELVNFTTPAIKKKAANSVCAIHKLMFSALFFFGSVFVILYVLFISVPTLNSFWLPYL